MTAEPDLLPLPEMDIYALGSGVGLRDVRHTPAGFSQKKMSEYARACVARATAARDAEIEALRAEVRHLWECAAGWSLTAGKAVARAERLAKERREFAKPEMAIGLYTEDDHD